MKNPRTTRVTIVLTPSLLNLRGSEFWVMDVSSLLSKSFIVSVVNFNYSRRYPKTPDEIRKRLRIVNAAFQGNVRLVRISGLSLRLPMTKLWRGTSLESFVERYLHFLPLSRRFLSMLHYSDVVYFVVSLGNPAYLLVGLAFATLAGRRPVVAGIHIPLKMGNAELALLKLAARIGALKAIHVVNRSHEPLLRRIGCPIEFIPNGIYFDKFYSDVEKKALQRRFTVLFVGAMTATKGAGVLPAIYTALKEEEMDFEMVICTSGGELAETIESWSRGKDNVQFKGFVERSTLAQIYSHASVAIFPSKREGLPLTSLEVQASGTPVVVSNDPGLSQTVIEGRSGVVVAVQDARAFAKGIAEIYSLWKDRRQEYLEMCKTAQENVRDNYRWNRVKDKLANLLLATARRDHLSDSA